MTAGGFSVGVVGATGAAGAEIIRQLASRGFPCRDLRLFGTIRTAGAQLEEEHGAARIELLGPGSGRGLDVVFFAAGPAVAIEFAPEMASAGALVVDVSSAFRADRSVPLVVPEVNGAVLSESASGGIVALPSPTAAVLAVVLGALGTVRSVTRVVVSTYQGVGTAGTRTLRALGRETIALLGGRGVDGPQSTLAFECRPMIGPMDESGASSHERSVVRDVTRVLGAGVPQMHVTAVRVPVFTGLGLSVVAELASPAATDEIDGALRRAPGLLVHAGEEVPTLRAVAGSPAVHVGRVRRDPSHPTAIALWAAADGIVKGQAGAAVAVAEMAIRARVS